MSKHEILSSTAHVNTSGLSVKLIFKIVNLPVIAGGPVEIETSIVGEDSHRLKIFIDADSMRSRVALYVFNASFNKKTLTDPMAGIPNTGGPEAAFVVSAKTPWRQVIILNDYLRLEDTLEMIEPGESGIMDINCDFSLRSTQMLESDNYDDEQVVKLSLRFNMQRDDEQLERLTKKLYSNCLLTPVDIHSLDELLSLRSLAMPYVRWLIGHPNADVAARALQVYNSLN